MWFTGSHADESGEPNGVVGRVTQSGEVEVFELPPERRPGEIVAGPDGNLWFTESGEGEFSRVGRITPQGRIVHFRLPGKKVVAGPIAVGPDGNLWFGESPREDRPGGRARIGRIDTMGRIREFRLPARSFLPALVSGPGGRLWYTARSGHGNLAIGSLSMDGTATEVECLPSSPACEIDADALAAGPDGALWLTASRYWPHMGGGGSGIFESMAEAKEAGKLGRFAP
jgi:virginiamycin B lyase